MVHGTFHSSLLWGVGSIFVFLFNIAVIVLVIYYFVKLYTKIRDIESHTKKVADLLENKFSAHPSDQTNTKNEQE